MIGCIYCDSDNVVEYGSHEYPGYHCRDCGQYFDDTDIVDDQPRFKRTRPRDHTEVRQRKNKPRRDGPDFGDYESYRD